MPCFRFAGGSGGGTTGGEGAYGDDPYGEGAGSTAEGANGTEPDDG